ncbi:MAG: TrkH family potassium uptake protein [Paracoccaceae bacterium]
MLRFLYRLPLFVILMGIASIAMLLPAIHASALDLHRIAQPFFYGAILFLVLTSLVGLATLDRKPKNMSRSHLLTLVSTFALLPVMLAVPMREAVPDASFLNVYFEMVSSLTTTGATVFDPPSRLAEPLHLWRALVAWLGGFLMLLAAVAIFAPMNLGGFEVLRPLRSSAQGAGMPAQDIRAGDPRERLVRFTAQLFPLYLGATLFLWVALVVTGMSPFFALVSAMSTLCTSGIIPGSTLDGSEGGIGAEILIFVFMIIAISRQTLQNDFNRAFLPRLVDDREMRLAFVLLTMVPLALFLRHWIGAFEVSEEGDVLAGLRALWGAAFTVLSFLTTTGFISDGWQEARAWSGLPTPGLILAGLAILGGGVATTAGGVKLLRVYALYKHGVREMGRLVHPSSIGSEGRLGREVRREGAFVAWIFFMLFALSIAAIMLMLAATGLSFEEAMVFAVASFSTTGPLAEVVLDGSLSYVTLSPTAKLVLSGAMVLGRLETLAIIALLNPDFWRS